MKAKTKKSIMTAIAAGAGFLAYNTTGKIQLVATAITFALGGWAHLPRPGDVRTPPIVPGGR